MSDTEQFFNSAEEYAEYEAFCAEQERGFEKFEPAEPVLVCRWRMVRRRVPLLNRHIRALSHRTVNGAPLTHNMLSWAKQHVEWSLAEGASEYDGVLMLVIDANGDALMSTGPYVPLPDATFLALRARAVEARIEASRTGIASELLGVATGSDHLLFGAFENEKLCGVATLVEQLAQTLGVKVERASVQKGSPDDELAFADSAPAHAPRFLISDEHGVVVAREQASSTSEAMALIDRLASGVCGLFE